MLSCLCLTFSVFAFFFIFVFVFAFGCTLMEDLCQNFGKQLATSNLTCTYFKKAPTTGNNIYNLETCVVEQTKVLRNHLKILSHSAS